MTFNTTSNRPIPEDAYYLWQPGLPRLSNDEASSIFIEINKNKDYDQGMLNSNPDWIILWISPDGVACWRPPIKTHGTTPDYGYGTSEPTSNREECDTSRFLFTQENHLDYVQYNGTFPTLESLTTCAWLRPAENNAVEKGTLLSYCTLETSGTGSYCNTLQIVLLSGTIDVSMVNAGDDVFTDVPVIDAPSHVCFAMSTHSGEIRYYLNGTEAATALNVASIIPGGGVFIIGQDQDGSINGSIPGAPDQDFQGFHGIIEGYSIWNRALSEAEINNLYESGCNCAADAILTFDSSNSILKGHVTAQWNRTCYPIIVET